MTALRRLQAKAQRWHLLGRYYVNKWHYDGSKWAERVWYGQGSTGNGPAVASVAFMITRSMRQQLSDAGFPASAISTLQPATAQQILKDQLSFEQFQKLQIQEAAEQAKQTLKTEQQQAALAVATTQNTEQQEQKSSEASALVIQPETSSETSSEQK